MEHREDTQTPRAGGPRHQRPRLGGDGRLVLPDAIAFDALGVLRGRLSDRFVDPFLATADRLLLAESYARLDVQFSRELEEWCLRHGAVDRQEFNGGFTDILAEQPPEHVGPHDLADARQGIEAEQENIRWHLGVLARLSERRGDMAWAPALGQLVVSSQDGDLIVGGPDAGEQRLRGSVLAYVRETAQRDPSFRAAAAEQDRLHAATDGWPVVTVTPAFWFGWWRHAEGEVGSRVPDEAREKARVLGSTWDQAIELERLLMDPYVGQAVGMRFTIEREAREVDGLLRAVVVPREVRVWRSILAPIYLQLFEALRRISEGEPGAAICRECGQPFLVLDARRRLFCNDRERYRYTQRQRRSRLAAEEAPRGSSEPPGASETGPTAGEEPG